VSKNSLDLKPLRWRLRRGMLELDVMLKRFVATQLDTLGDTELRSLDQLLDLEDDLLWDWLSGREIPPQKDLARLVERIRTAR
jgi:antitoxin CptB